MVNKITLPLKLVAKIKADRELKQYQLTANEAFELLETFYEGRKKRIHTQEPFFGVIMGCNVDFSEIKKRLKESNFISLTHKFGGGIVYRETKGNYMFLPTIKEKLDAKFKARKIKVE